MFDNDNAEKVFKHIENLKKKTNYYTFMISLCTQQIEGYLKNPTSEDNDKILAEFYFQRAEVSGCVNHLSNRQGDDYDEAIRLNPSMANYYARRAQFNLLQNKAIKNIISDYNKALELDPHNQDYLDQRDQLSLKINLCLEVKKIRYQEHYENTLKNNLIECQKKIAQNKNSKVITQLKFVAFTIASAIAVSFVFAGIAVAAVLPLLIPVWSTLIAAGALGSLLFLPPAMYYKQNLTQIDRRLSKLNSQQESFEVQRLSKTPVNTPTQKRQFIFTKPTLSLNMQTNKHTLDGLASDPDSNTSSYSPTV